MSKTVSNLEHEMVPEDELRELFRPHRPDPAAFGAGIEHRAGEREREAARTREDERRHPLRAVVWRRAAAVLGLESAAISNVGKAAGSKFLPAALALPVLLVASALAASYASARALLRLGPAGGDAPDPTETVVGRSKGGLDGLLSRRRHERRVEGLLRRRLRPIENIGVFAWFAIGTFLVGRHAIDGVLVALLISMAGLVHCTRDLARSVGLARSEVQHVCARLLMMLALFLAGSVSLFRTPDVDSGIGIDASLLVLCAGLLACAAPGAARLHASVWAALILLVFQPPLACVSSPWMLRAQLDDYGGYASGDDWPAAAATVLALREAGEAPPDLAPLRAKLDRMLSAQAGGPHPRTWTALADIGVVDAALWRWLDDGGYLSDEVDALLRLDARLGSHGELWRLSMLLAARDVTDELRAQLLAVVDRSWPNHMSYDPIDDAYACVRAYDALGRPDLADARRDDVQRILSRCWVPWGMGLASRRAGFAPDQSEPDQASHKATWQAVALMQRLGVPDEIDLAVLRGHLRTDVQGPLGLIEFSPGNQGYARASLLLLERSIGLPPRTPLERLLGERLLLSSILFVALCLLAIRQARDEPE